jgi:hypothetical protein
MMVALDNGFHDALCQFTDPQTTFLRLLRKLTRKDLCQDLYWPFLSKM